MKTVLVAAAASLAPLAANAQTSPAPLVVGAAPQSPALHAGTPVALRMKEQLTTKDKAARVGQRFQLEVADPILVDGQVVIPAGASATGEITEVRNKGMWGKSGRIAARLLYVRVGDRQIRLTGTFDDKGTTGTAGVVGAVAFVPVAGFFVTGTSATIPVGAPVGAFIDEEVPLAFAAPSRSPAAAPIVVGRRR